VRDWEWGSEGGQLVSSRSRHQVLAALTDRLPEDLTIAIDALGATATAMKLAAEGPP